MIDPNGIKFKTHKFQNTPYKNLLVCSNCGIEIKQYAAHGGSRTDFYIGSWFVNSMGLEDIMFSCEEYMIKDIIE